MGSATCSPCILIRPSQSGLKCSPSRDKVEKWMQIMKQYLLDGILPAGDAAKLGGKLNWGASSLFRRLGRAMLRPVYDQCTRRDGKILKELERALNWWVTILHQDICVTRAWASKIKISCTCSVTLVLRQATLLLC